MCGCIIQKKCLSKIIAQHRQDTIFVVNRPPLNSLSCALLVANHQKKIDFSYNGLNHVELVIYPHKLKSRTTRPEIPVCFFSFFLCVFLFFLLPRRALCYTIILTYARTVRNSKLIYHTLILVCISDQYILLKLKVYIKTAF